MAINIQQKFSVDLNSVVENSITSVKAVRKSEQTRKEAEFQRAIANGLSYEEQLIMREKQLEEEKKSSLSDESYISDLEKSVADTKKLNRFNKYRRRYAETFGNLNSGKINEEQYLSILKNQLIGIDDPDLRLEIQNDIASAETQVKTYKKTILDNQVRKAKYDGTKDVLTEAVARVNMARTQALIDNNEDEVTAHDETLSALNSQLSSVRVQDAVTDFEVKSSTRGTSPIERLDFMNSEILKADPNVPVRINDKTYNSAQQFWSLERDNYLSDRFFKDLDEDVKNNINTNTARFGYPTQGVLDQTFKTFGDLRARPEMTPFLNRLDITQSSSMSDAVIKFTDKVIDAAETSLEFDFADTQIKSLGQKYGIDTSTKRSELFQRVRGLEQGQLIPAGSTERLAAKLQVDIPEIKEEIVAPKAPATPTVPEKPVVTAIPPTTPAIPEVPKEKPPATPSPMVEAPQFTPAGGIGAKSDDGKFTFTNEGWKPTAPIPTETPTATPVPITPATPSTYAGVSVVDYLKSQKQDASFESRKKLAAEKGITDYAGTAKQNEELLKLLRG